MTMVIASADHYHATYGKYDPILLHYCVTHAGYILIGAGFSPKPTLLI